MMKGMNELQFDPRLEFSYCMQCGGCTAVCPAASINPDYNPREMVYRILNGIDRKDYPYDDCFHCYSCKYVCKLGNTPADIAKIMSEKTSMADLNKDYKIYDTFYEKGLCITPEILMPENFPDWGESYERAWHEVRKFKSKSPRVIPPFTIKEIQKIVNTSERANFSRRETSKIQSLKKTEDYKKKVQTDKIYFFKSCFMDSHYPGATESIRFILDKLGVDYIDDPCQSSCTGFAYYANIIPFKTTININARNFAIAEAKGYNNIATACVTSYGVLNECKAMLDNGAAEESNKILKEIGLKYTGNININHIFEIFYYLIPEIERKITKKFEDLPVAVHYGCHYTKMFRDLAIPNSLESLVSVTGATPVEYTEKNLCCGMGFSHTLNNRTDSRKIAERKLRSIKDAGAKVVVTACPGCQITFDRNQATIEEKTKEKFGLVYLNYAQLIALAMGADPYDTIGIQTHSNPVEPILRYLDR